MRHGFTDGLYHSFCIFARFFEDLILSVRSWCLCTLIRGLENLETPGREGFFVILFVPNKKYVKVFKGFNFVCAKLPLRRAESRFGKPRCSLQRERVVTFCVVQKVTKKHAGLRPATSIQSSVEEDFSEVFRQHESNPFFRTKRRRKGFESVRKGYCSADARPMFFEKELLYCKLTVGCRR